MTAVRPDDTAGTGERMVAGMRERYKARTRDDGFHDEATGHWVRMLASVRPAGHKDVLALCDMADALVAAVREAEAERDEWREKHRASEKDYRIQWLAREAAEAQAERAERALEVPRQYDVLVSDWKDRADAYEKALREIANTFEIDWHEAQEIAREALAAVSGEAPNDAPWKCSECGGADLSFDRSLCACGSMHYFCGDCGVQDDPCSPVAGGPGDAT